MKTGHSKLIIAGALFASLLLGSVIYDQLVEKSPEKAVALPERESRTEPERADARKRQPAPYPSTPAEVLGAATKLAATPALTDRYADEHMAGLDALVALRDEYVAWGGRTEDFDSAMSADLQSELHPEALLTSRGCAADLPACLLAKANNLDRLAALGGDVCERAAYAVALADRRERLDQLRCALERNAQDSCLDALIVGLVDAKRGEDLAAILSEIKDDDSRLQMTRLAINRIRDIGIPEGTVQTLLKQRVGDMAETKARQAFLGFLASEGKLELGRQLIGDGGGDTWLDEMEVFQRDLAHWNHHDDAGIIQEEITKRYPSGMLGKVIRLPGQVAGKAGRMAGDVGRLTDRMLATSHDIPPSKWVHQKLSPAFSEIDVMKEKQRHAALLDALAEEGAAAETKRREAASRLLNSSKPPRNDTQTSELALQQVRGGRLWAAVLLLDQIADEKTRLKTAAQAVVDLNAYAPK